MNVIVPEIRDSETHEGVVNPQFEVGDVKFFDGSNLVDVVAVAVDPALTSISVTLTDAQAANLDGVLVFKDQTDPAEWYGPIETAGPFDSEQELRRIPRAEAEIEAGDPVTHSGNFGGTVRTYDQSFTS